MIFSAYTCCYCASAVSRISSWCHSCCLKHPCCLFTSLESLLLPVYCRRPYRSVVFASARLFCLWRPCSCWRPLYCCSRYIMLLATHLLLVFLLASLMLLSSQILKFFFQIPGRHCRVSWAGIGPSTGLGKGRNDRIYFSKEGERFLHSSSNIQYVFIIRKTV